MNIGVIGCGVVGEAVACGFEAKGLKVGRYDKYKPGIDTFAPILKKDVLFLCLPSLTKPSGEQDLSAIHEIFEKLSFAEYTGIVVLKSTVLPGTTDLMSEKYGLKRVVHNPEFLTAANAHKDFLNQPSVLLGSRHQESMFEIADLYSMAKLGDQFRLADSPVQTEVAKYMHNLFLSMKVTFCNEIYEVCKHLNIPYDTVKDMAVSAQGIGPGHTKVPGPDGLVGFGGMCFLKDTKAFLKYSKDINIKMDTLEATVSGNFRRRKE